MALVPFANRQKRTVFRYLKTVRLFYCFIITSPEQIIKRNIKIIRKANESFIIRLALKVFTGIFDFILKLSTIYAIINS